MSIDKLDRQILAIYQHDTRLAAEEIGAQVGLSAAAVQRRLKRLREDGVIVADLAAYEAFCDACLLHDANVRSFTTQIVLESPKRVAPVDLPA